MSVAERDALYRFHFDHRRFVLYPLPRCVLLLFCVFSDIDPHRLRYSGIGGGRAVDFGFKGADHPAPCQFLHPPSAQIAFDQGCGKTACLRGEDDCGVQRLHSGVPADAV